jgi:hypothetical protein
MSPDGRTKQQFSAAEIIQQCQAGSIDDSTLVWREGLPDWAPLAEVPELARAVRAFSRAPSTAVANVTALPNQRPSLPTLPPTPSLPPRAASTTPPGSLGQRLSLRVTNLVIDERQARPLGGGPPSHRVGERPLSLLDVDEPYSLLLPGGRRVGVWSLATGAGVFAVCCAIGVLLFGANDDASEAFEDAEPVLVNLDTPASSPKSANADGNAPSVEETTDPPLNEEGDGDDKLGAKAANEAPKKLESKIDRDAVTKALSAAAKEAAQCEAAAKAKGSGKVKVVFEPSGRVSRVTLLSPQFEGTQTGGCVALAFRNVKVPPYEGGRVSAVKSFSVK